MADATSNRFHLTGRARQRLTIGLRTLAVTAVAVALLFGWQSNHVRHQRLVIAEVAKFDARIHYDHELRGEIRPPGPRWLRRFFGDDFFTTVAGIEIVADRVTDETVAAISSLPHLKTLLVDAEGIDDPALTRLALARELEQLTFRSATVTDAGLAQLTVLRMLTSLTIATPRITDVGLIPLEDMHNLTSLQLFSTDVTHEGIARLRTALPNCEVRVVPEPAARL